MSQTNQDLNGQMRAYAEWAYAMLAKDLRIPHDVIDDGCFERCEAMIGIMRTEMDIPPHLIGRAYNINPDARLAIHARNPLARGDQLHDLKHFLANSAEDRNAQSYLRRHHFSVTPELGLQFGSITFSESPDVAWRTGHIAPMVGPYVIDPSLGKGVLTFDAWKRLQGLEDSIPLYTREGQLPELVPALLSDRMLADIESRMGITQATVDRTQRESSIRQALAQAGDAHKNRFYDGLFAQLISEGQVYPRQYWNDMWIGKINTRGERGSENDATALHRRQFINHALQSDWPERKAMALEALQPFHAYRELVHNVSEHGKPTPWQDFLRDTQQQLQDFIRI